MKKPTKRKMYQKRRKREKAQQRKKEAEVMLFGKNATSFNGISPKTQQHRPAGNSYKQLFVTSPITSYSEGLQLWWQTYCSAIEFHCKQQNAFEVDSQENQLRLLEKYANEYETSSEEDDENEVKQWSNFYEESLIEDIHGEAEEECVDEDYIKFLEITHKHQEELRLKRAEDYC